MSEPNLPPTGPRPCFSCADKNVLLKKSADYIGTLKRKIDTLEGTWFTPALMKETQMKILRLEHCRDSLLEESRSQRLTIKAQSAALYRIYSDAELKARIAEYPIMDKGNVFPLHHRSDYLESVHPTRCDSHGPTTMSPATPDVAITGVYIPAMPDVSSANTSYPQRIVSTELPKTKRKKRLTSAEKTKKRREEIATLEATLFAVSQAKVVPPACPVSSFKVVPATVFLPTPDPVLENDIAAMLIEGDI